MDEQTYSMQIKFIHNFLEKFEQETSTSASSYVFRCTSSLRAKKFEGEAPPVPPLDETLQALWFKGHYKIILI